jgi:acyl-CoA synthetase (AMP-forming)/AMP-acid ligase II
MSNLGQLLAGSNVALDQPVIWSDRGALTRADLLAAGTRLPPKFRNRSVALQMSDPLAFVEALFALDGQAASIAILSAELPALQTAQIMALAGADCLIDTLPVWVADNKATATEVSTQWQLTTSGTTGTPKLAGHDFGNLAWSVKPPRAGTQPVWGLLYEPSRFAGLQVILQALAGGGRLVLTEPHDSLGQRVSFLASQHCTHLSATPSMWRKILMDSASDALALQQITLGGEIADDRILLSLRHRFPDARISHIYASTEVGVGFAVTDGRAGFSSAMLDDSVGPLKLKLVDGVLWIRPPVHLAKPRAGHIQSDVDGFICTGDRIALSGDRALFLGRDASVVNVGGVKLQLEHLEERLRENPLIRDGVFSAIKNPILGSILHLTVVPEGQVDGEPAFKRSLKAWCRDHMQAEAVPAKIELVTEITLAASGKIRRKIA